MKSNRKLFANLLRIGVNMSTNTRRDFIKKSAQGLAGVALAGGFLNWISLDSAYAKKKKKKKSGASGGSDQKLIDTNAPMAKNVRYQHDKSKITDAALKIEKQGVKWADQKCSNCVLYNAVVDKVDGKAVGKCSLFPQNVVAAEGWCTTWAKKG